MASAGNHPSAEAVLFANDVAGESWLDVRAGAGERCFEALTRGAKSATGLEISPELLRRAHESAAALEVRPEFIAADFEEWSAPARSYDVVLCLGELHHLYQPVAAIRKVMQLARKRFYLEVASPATWVTSHAPIMLLGNPKEAIRAADRTFAFTNKSVRIIVNAHSKAYEPVRFHASDSRRSWIVEARRRQIDHLIVLGGSSGSGKSHFLRRLAEPEMRARFGIADDYTVLKPEGLDRLPAGPISTLVYHYDLLRPFNRPLRSHERDPAFHLLSCSNRTTLITFANQHEVVRERMQGRKERRRERGREARERHDLLIRQYENPVFLADWYEAWLNATERHVGRPQDRTHFLLSEETYPELPDRDAVLKLFVAG